MGELIPGVEYQAFVAAAGACRTEQEFRASRFFAEHGSALEGLLATPIVVPAEGSAPRGTADRALRLVHWNIEKGKRLAGLVDRFRGDPDFRDADVITLNEVDVGMARAGPNADVGLELARAWGGHLVYLPAALECTKGIEEERALPGENERGLHGIAILTRFPVRAVGARSLPHCWDYFDFWEKRFGRRQGLYVLLDGAERGLGTFVVATTHLEVRRTPACRAAQFRAFLAGLDEHLARWGGDLPAVITGDWNTNTFPRGGLLNSIRGFLRIVSTPAARLDRDLVAPEKREPLFASLEEAGMEWRNLTDARPTASQHLGTVEDLGIIPDWLGRSLLRAVAIEGRVLEMRLDWIAARGLASAAPPRTLSPGDPPLSDHAPIAASLMARLP